ncbi:YjbF family lipoprotein [Pseudidiomarina insulisalsae]|uniref:Capsule biosynthesis GfcC-like N-terminal domain-containing protein n=1 Tax=Pseudidiomarina insulisalsae TaxID=575789 RepID=A0A432YNV9_9GAMM|nr:YjbF family lipoprotein [Pseudidiomarina insulisalsae]RUO62634.1 hypothetical protein CWI71_04165 [Pseudidiomarina insulisalsae]
MRGVTTVAVLLGVTSVISGCSLLSSQEDTQTTAATESLQFLFADAPSAPDRETLTQFPYPVTYVQFAKGGSTGPRTILVLAATGTHGQYWFSAGNEALVLWQGRVIRSSQLQVENRLHTDNLHADPLACYLTSTSAPATQKDDPCAGSWSRTIQLKRPVANFNPHQPQYEIVSLELQSQLQRNGRDISETGTASEVIGGDVGASYDFTNSYRLSTDGNYVISSRQWLSPRHGYVELEMVNLAQPNAPRGEVQTTDFKVPINAFKGSGAEPRLREFVEAMQPEFYPDSYWPGLRIHSDKLDQRFAAKRAGMIKRLRMLVATYEHDKNTKLAQAAKQLLNDFQQWPLRASYVHGIDPAQMRVTLKHNPLLNSHDANEAYEIVLAEAGTQQLGLQTKAQDLPEYLTERWQIQPDGSVRQLHAHVKQTAEQPGIVLTSIAERYLPKGFRDINAQLAMFLQHWNYAASVQESAQ